MLLSTLIASKLFVVGLVSVRGDSMAPEIMGGASCLVTKLGPVTAFGYTLVNLKPQRDHRVVARPKGWKNYLIKRVAAASQERLPDAPWLKHWRLSKTAAGKRVRKAGIRCDAQGCHTQKDHVFLISNQLKGTSDSRLFGAVSHRRLLGRVAVCF